MKINPFDKTEWPLGWMSPANWHKAEFINAFHNWREKWEPKYVELEEKAEKLGDISSYPEIKFGHMTVLDFLDLVELQADTYTRRAITAEQKLNAIKAHITHQNLSTYGLDLRKFTRVSMNPKDFHSFIGDLEKILDDSEFRNKGEDEDEG